MWRRLQGLKLPTVGAPTPAAEADQGLPGPEPAADHARPLGTPDAGDLHPAAKPPLPEGLRWCEACGEPRGKTPSGRVSSCLCSGVRCRWCGQVSRRPISDYYKPATDSWSHVPYFELMGHACERPAGVSPTEERWQDLEPAPEVAEYQQAMTRLALQGLEERAEARRRFARGEDVPPSEMGILYLAPGLEVRRSAKDGRPIVVAVDAPEDAEEKW